MESSARGANGGTGSPLDALSGLRDRLRGKAAERLGPEPAQRLKSVANEKLKSVGGDRLPAGTGDRLRSVTGGLGGDAAGDTGPAPPFEERPEIYVGAAFAGGVLLAGVIRLLAR